MAEGCSQCSDSVLGRVGTFVFVFGWVGYQGIRASRKWWFDRGRAGVGIFPSAPGGWLYDLVSPVREPAKSMANNNQQDNIGYPATIDHVVQIRSSAAGYI